MATAVAPLVLSAGRSRPTFGPSPARRFAGPRPCRDPGIFQRGIGDDADRGGCTNRSYARSSPPLLADTRAPGLCLLRWAAFPAGTQDPGPRLRLPVVHR